MPLVTDNKLKNFAVKPPVCESLSSYVTMQVTKSLYTSVSLYVEWRQQKNQDDRVEVKTKLKYPCGVVGRIQGTEHHPLGNCYYCYHHYYYLLAGSKRETETENYSQSYLNIP